MGLTRLHSKSAAADQLQDDPALVRDLGLQSWKSAAAVEAEHFGEDMLAVEWSLAAEGPC